MRSTWLIVAGLILSSCSDNSPESTQIQGFTISEFGAHDTIAITGAGANTVYINRLAFGPGEHPKGTAVLVLHSTTKAQTLEALDVNGDGYWDTVRYLAKTPRGLVRVEDNDGDGVVDYTAPLDGS